MTHWLLQKILNVIEGWCHRENDFDLGMATFLWGPKLAGTRSIQVGYESSKTLKLKMSLFRG